MKTKLKEIAPMKFHNCIPENRYPKFSKGQPRTRAGARVCVCVCVCLLLCVLGSIYFVRSSDFAYEVVQVETPE